MKFVEKEERLTVRSCMWRERLCISMCKFFFWRRRKKTEIEGLIFVVFQGNWAIDFYVFLCFDIKWTLDENSLIVCSSINSGLHFVEAKCFSCLDNSPKIVVDLFNLLFLGVASSHFSFILKVMYDNIYRNHRLEYMSSTVSFISVFLVLISFILFSFFRSDDFFSIWFHFIH